MRGDFVVANVILPADAEDLPLTFYVNIALLKFNLNAATATTPSV